MIGLQAADIVIIAARVRGIKTSKALELIDIEAAEVALSRANQVTGDPAAAAATMLSALLRRPVLPSGGERVAVLAMAQFLALNGFDVDLDPPEETKDLLAAVAAGGVGAAELGDWLVSRLTIRLPSGHDQRATLRRWLPRRRGKFGRDRYGRFTDRAKTAVTLADEEARRLGHNYIGTEHILLGLVREGGGVAAESLGALGVSGDTIRQRIEGIVGRGGDSPTGYIPFTPRAKKAMFECALRETMRLGHTYIGTEHLLLGLIREGHGLAAEVLVNLGADHMKVKHEVHRRLASRPDAGRSLADLAEENRRLRSEVARLRSLLHRHGIEPGEDPPAAAEAAP